jgi:putative glutamine amidotransferase
MAGQLSRRPRVGIIGSAYSVDGRFAVQMAGERNFRAVWEAAGAMPLLFPSMPEILAVPDLLEAVDGILLTGARANVHPSRYGHAASPAHEPYDERRDALALALVEACVLRAVPLFGVCRGLQEMAVAFGSTLHPEIRDLPGRMNHRMPRLANGEIHPDPLVIFQDRHDVTLTPGGQFHALYGRDVIRVNSLHGQGILDTGARVRVEGVADDTTIEAISIEGAQGFALGVQWHAEYDAQQNVVNGPLFRAFGEALTAQVAQRA